MGCFALADIAGEIENIATSADNIFMLKEKINALQSEWEIAKKKIEE